MTIFKSRYEDVEVPTTSLPEFIFGPGGSFVADFTDDVAIFDSLTKQSHTHGQLYAMVQNASQRLHKHGVRKGDVLLIHSPNVAEYAVAFHACLQLGVTLTTASPLYTPDELAHQITDAGVTHVITFPSLREACEKALAVAGVAPKGQWLFASREAAGAFQPFCALCAPVADGVERAALADAVRAVTFDPKTHVACIPYSSGTTGLPKGVLLSHTNLAANVAQAMQAESRLARADCFMGVLPFYHIYGMIMILNIALKVGAKVVTMPRFDMVGFLELAQAHKATYLHVVPPIVLGLAKHPVVDKYDLSSVQYVFSGAAPLSEALETAVSARLDCGVKQGYGMTEMSPASHITPYKDEKVPHGTCGVLLANMECKIVDPESGEAVGVGQEGELWLRGPNVMLGYHRREDATKATVDAEGFLHTGDVGRVDADGFYFITDRIKELIKTNGRQVAPAELEGVIQQHPAVADCAVVGRPDESAGEFPCAFVVKKDGAEVAEKDIFDWVAERCAPYKKLKGGVVFVDQIPKSLSGKILRRVLKDRLKEEAAAQSK